MRRLRRRSVPRVALILVIAAWWSPGCDFSAQATVTPTDAATERPTSSPAPAPTAEPSVTSTVLPPLPEGPTQDAVVTRVIDGDTIEVEVDGEVHEVHYLGIDAPDISEDGDSDEPLGREALAANRGLVNEQMVILEQDVSDTDAAGRLLRYVWVDVNGTLRLVNHVLLARGFAELLTDQPDSRYEIALRIAEAAARERQAGIWGPDAAPTETAEASDDASAASEEPGASAAPIVNADEIAIGTDQVAFRGEAGTVRWTTIRFTSVNDFLVRWSATSTSGGCEMAWTITGSAEAAGESSLTEPGQANGRTRLVAPDGDGTSELSVTSDCRKWLITFNEIEPPPTPAPTAEPTPQSTAGASDMPTIEAPGRTDRRADGRADLPAQRRPEGERDDLGIAIAAAVFGGGRRRQGVTFTAVTPPRSAARASSRRASSKSNSVRPPSEWVWTRRFTVRHRTSISGW